MAHTAGPWMSERYPTKYPDIHTWSILQTHRHVGEDHRYGIVSGLDSEDDARLIAAAPDLLEALRDMETSRQHGYDLPWGTVRAAIAKATTP